ncbi:MAG: hypothetical protein IH984_09715 [Planctomycetes bacterium]|nr:hypothetical protein [Planctomycetota bacterium]
MKQKKSKPWYRLRNVFLAIVFAIITFLGWAFIEVWQVYTAEPNPTIDSRTQLRTLAAQHANVSRSHGEEAWNILIDALEKTDRIELVLQERIIADGFEPRDDYDDVYLQYDRVYGGRTFPNNVQREINALNIMRNEGVFELLNKFSASGVAIEPSDSTDPLILDTLKLHRSKMRNVAQLLTASMRLSFNDGNYNQLVESCKNSLALSSTISFQGTLIDYLIAMAIEQLTLRELQYELIEASLDEKTCQLLLNALNKYNFAPIELVIEGERISLKDQIQWSFSDDGDGDGYLVSGLMEYIMPGITEPEQTISGAFASRFSYPSKAELLSLVDQRFDECIARSQVLPSLRISLIPPWGKRSMNSNDHYVLVNMPVDSMLSTIDRRPTLQVIREGTCIMLAIEIYNARHSRWPDSLNDLVPEILPQLPVDTLHGGPFGYRVVDDDRYGRPYFLYSFGLDATDDGGIELIGSDGEIHLGREALNEPNSAGLDYIINKPRPEEW